MKKEGELIMGFRKATNSTAVQVTVTFSSYSKLKLLDLIFNHPLSRKHYHLICPMVLIQVKLPILVFMRIYLY